MAAEATIEISNITLSSINVAVTAYSSGDTSGTWTIMIVTNYSGTTYDQYPSNSGDWYSPDTIPIIGKTYTVPFSFFRINSNNPNTAFDTSEALSRMYYSPFNLYIYKTSGGQNSNPGTFKLNAPYVTEITAGGASGGGGIACFTRGSEIRTPVGYVAIESISNGDVVLTADARPVSVKIFKTDIITTKETAPYFIPKTVFGLQQDLRLSPWHAFQIKKGLWMKPQTAAELYEDIIQYDVGKTITYYHLETPNYFKDNLICGGSVVESYGGNQLHGMKVRMYHYNPTLKGYTRLASKPAGLAKH